MYLKSNIPIDLSRKTLWILFTLFVGISFSAGGVMANSCQGGPDCFNCATAAHPHIPGMDLEMVNQGCQSAEQNRSCGIETGHSVDEFDNTTAVVNSGTQPNTGIFSAAFDQSDQADLHREFITPFQNPDRSELTPIYLLNQSLLC